MSFVARSLDGSRKKMDFEEGKSVLNESMGHHVKFLFHGDPCSAFSLLFLIIANESPGAEQDLSMLPSSLFPGSIG
jgi:hypothetical protein